MKKMQPATAVEIDVEDVFGSVQDTSETKYKTEDITFDEQYTAEVPTKDPLYEPFGNYYDVEQITASEKFFPYWIYGLSGNGKTYSIEQAHARLKKRLVNIPITKEADEDSLLGGLRLVNGTTVPFFGPITLAALLGVTALLDEIDLGDEKLMCLQTPLQNRPYLIKRLGKVIVPKFGFNVVATANTKGQGSVDGKFIGANIMNEAMLDRFRCTFEQDYPDAKTERKILKKVLASLGHKSEKENQFIDRLIDWAEKIRKTFKENGTSEVITTRRLVHICHAYDMFGKDRKKSVERCLARFNDDIKTSFRQLYEAIDEDANKKDSERERIRIAVEKGTDPLTPF
jgi:hypothetical protein